MPVMLSSKYRIPKAEIISVIKKGQTKTSEGFYVKYLLNDSLANNQYSFSISTKVSKKATIRNRIKRIFRAAVFEIEQSGKLAKGSYAFVIKSAELRNNSSDEVLEMIMRLFL